MFLIRILPLFAGIGLFLYGMSLLGGALEKIAGAKLERMLEKLTSSKIKGVLLGTAVTGVIQSSSATTIMVIGLLNAGIMKLYQAVPVIMGANIGTTITGQILRLGDLGDTTFLLAMMKPSSFGPLLIGIGAAMNLFAKKRKVKDIGIVLLGLGMLFFGMNTMEVTLSPLKEQSWFQDVFFLFKNPFLGILLGALMTAILQSSSASVGILQALSSTGAITFSTAIPIILGQNVGKCITVLLASIGSKKNAKRAVFIDILSNTICMIVLFVIIYSYQLLIGFSFWDSSMTRGNIADFHTLFNIMTTLLLLPFVSILVTISKKFVKDREASQEEKDLAMLDDLLLKTPNMAIEQSKKSLLTMMDIVLDNFEKGYQLIFEYNQSAMDEVLDNEDLLDRYEAAIDNYLVKICGLDVKVGENKSTTEMLHTVGDLERIGDHVVNIGEVAEYNQENSVLFSAQALEEIKVIGSAVKEILAMTKKAYLSRELKDTVKIEPLEQVIDLLQYQLKAKHIERLRDGKCNVQAGVSFLELLTNFERISDHCSNIAVYIIQAYEDNYHDFSAHSHLTKVHAEPTNDYIASYNYFTEKYKLSKEI